MAKTKTPPAAGRGIRFSEITPGSLVTVMDRIIPLLGIEIIECTTDQGVFYEIHNKNNKERMVTDQIPQYQKIAAE